MDLDELDGTQSPKKNIAKTPALDNFGRDLTQLAKENKLDPIIGREDEITRVSQILSRRKKNNPVLIGDPGVGKTAIAEGLALNIINRKTSRLLFDMRVVALDLTSMIAGTKFRGQFEERIKTVMDEVKTAGNIILFIDELHTLIGAGSSSGSMDAANILKPALARGEIQVVGATTIDEYRHIEKDGALERRFQKIIVDPTSIENTITILNNVKDRYEAHHLVTYTDKAIEACVKLTDRYISERFLPDKAFDALDEVGSRTHLMNVKVSKDIENIEKQIQEILKLKQDAINKQKYEKAANYRDNERQLENELSIEILKWEKENEENKIVITEDDVAVIVSQMSGIPVTKVDDTDNVIHLKDNMLKNIIGQDDAIIKVTKSIQRSRVGLNKKNKPIGSFFFLGATGVGKTLVAKELAKEMFGSEDALIRVDMSEYMEAHNVSKLIGAPPGYVGYDEGGQLTEKVRKKPYSVILLDEIEKAHPKIFNALLQALDDGHMTDGLGRKISFKNTIILMTSNIGVRKLQDFGNGVGFNTKTFVQTEEDKNSILRQELSKKFAPEFLNRLDDVIIFNSLKFDDIMKIIDIELDDFEKRLSELDYSLNIDKKAKEFLVNQGWDEKFGARPLSRAIQKFLEDPIAEEILNKRIKMGDTIKVTHRKNANELKIS